MVVKEGRYLWSCLAALIELKCSWLASACLTCHPETVWNLHLRPRPPTWCRKHHENRHSSFVHLFLLYKRTVNKFEALPCSVQLGLLSLCRVLTFLVPLARSTLHCWLLLPKFNNDHCNGIMPETFVSICNVVGRCSLFNVWYHPTYRGSQTLTTLRFEDSTVWLNTQIFVNIRNGCFV